MDILSNFDLFSVGLSMAAIGILGFVVFLNDRKSTTNKSFLMLSIMSICWSLFNYLSYQSFDVFYSFWFLRIAIFFAVWYSFYVFKLSYIFPLSEFKFPKWYKFFLVPTVVLVSILNLTPFVLNKVIELFPDGRIARVENDFGIVLFGLAVVGLVVGGLLILLIKTIKAKKKLRKQYSFILVGSLISYSLLIIFNFIFPAILNEARYVTLGALFILPFIASTSYAIIRHQLLDVKVISTEILTFVLVVALLFDVISSDSTIILFFRASIFLLVLAIGLLLIKSVRKEVEQRNKVAKLAKRLKRANNKLKELDELKTEFLSIASHQLRTPLSIIKGYTSLLDEGAYGEMPKKAKEIFNNIDISNERLIKLVDEFLDVSRLEQGRTQYNFCDTNLITVVEEIVTELKEKAVPKKIKLKLIVDKKVRKVCCDGEKMRHCVYNYIDNAIKYSREGSEVQIFIEEMEGMVSVRVVDTGAGLDRKDIKNLFQKFYRSPHVMRDVQGTGLGLFVCKQFVEAHGGKVWAKSKGIKKGSEFGLCIPLRGKRDGVGGKSKKL